MKVQTSELIGRALNWAVGIANGWITYPTDSVEHGTVFHTDAAKAPFGQTLHVGLYEPSTDWWTGGPIIEREKIHTHHRPSYIYDAGIQWGAGIGQDTDCPIWLGFGPTLLIAAMRCYVASKLGDEVEIPEELCPST